MSTVAAPAAQTNRRVNSEKKNPKEYVDAEARVEVGRSAWERNQRKANRPAPPPSPYQVTFGEKSAKVMALSEREAWAKFCDELKTYPSPKSAGITITKIDE
jgi:hypothetical protein